MKKRYKVLIVLFVILAIIGSGFAYLINKSQREFDIMMAQEIEPLDLLGVSDGVYRGEYFAFPIGVIVNVTIENHLITKIELVKHTNGQGEPAEIITDDVVARQSLDIDLISGASYSSKVILLAIDDAFKN